MLHFARQPYRRQRSAPGRRTHGGLDSPARVEMAARSAGVELRVAGAESCERTSISARVARGGSVPDDLAGAIKKHRVGLVERLLAREPVGDGEGVPEHARDKTLGEVWPASALTAQAKAGHRVARLYVFIDGRVWTTEGTGLLVDAKSHGARLLLDSEVARTAAEAAAGGRKKPDPRTATVPVGDVWPPAGPTRERGQNGSGEAVSELPGVRRGRIPHDREDDQAGGDGA